MLKSLLAAVLATGLTVAPIAAQAGERASANTVSLAQVAQQPSFIFGGSDDDDECVDDITLIDPEDDCGGLRPAAYVGIAIFLGLVAHEMFTSKGIFD